MITDRTSDDTYYNHSDLNRVEAKTREVADLLTAHGYPVTITTRTNWVKGEPSRAVEANRYLGNIKKCVTQFNEVPGVTLPVSMKSLKFTGANDIEKVLIGLEEMISMMTAVFRECGTFYCGE